MSSCFFFWFLSVTHFFLLSLRRSEIYFTFTIRSNKFDCAPVTIRSHQIHSVRCTSSSVTNEYHLAGIEPPRNGMSERANYRNPSFGLLSCPPCMYACYIQRVSYTARTCVSPCAFHSAIRCLFSNWFGIESVLYPFGICVQRVSECRMCTVVCVAFTLSAACISVYVRARACVCV